VMPDGTLQPIVAALPTTQSAACWLITSGNGRYAYVTNTGSDTITGLTLNRDGTLGLLEPTGVTAESGDAPIDCGLSGDGRYLYVLNGADATIRGYLTRPDGGLIPLDGVANLPASVNGLAVR